MNRRELMTLIGGAVASWPLAARAQQPAMPLIGLLAAPNAASYQPYVDAVRQGLKEAGYTEGPVQQSTKVELMLNLKTAKTLGLAFPLTLLGRADEVIE
jgi:hypothetical protein